MVDNLKQIFRLLWRGLFLEGDAYDDAAEGQNPFVEGLFLVVIVGLVVAIARWIGAALSWASSPDPAQLQTIILDGLRAMPWYEQISSIPQAVQQFETIYNTIWQVIDFVSPDPITSLSGLLTTPLTLIVSWLWFTLIAYAVARLLGGKGKAGQTLGATALASSPFLLNVFSIVPTVTVAAVGTLTLLARYIAVRRVHADLSWPRVLTATLAPGVILIVLAVILGLLVVPALGAMIGGLAS